jgi:hypothetical protein
MESIKNGRSLRIMLSNSLRKNIRPTIMIIAYCLLPICKFLSACRKRRRFLRKYLLYGHKQGKEITQKSMKPDKLLAFFFIRGVKNHPPKQISMASQNSKDLDSEIMKIPH